MDKLQELREAESKAIEELRSAADALEATEDKDALDAAQVTFDEAEARAKEAKEARARFERIQEARAAFPTPEKTEVREVRSDKGKATYRPDGSHSFFRDLVFSGKGDNAAVRRLERHGEEMRAQLKSDTAAEGAEFIPPVYLSELFVSAPRAGRPFADAIGSRELPSIGTEITIPKLNPGTSADVQNGDLAAVVKNAAGSAEVKADMVTIAGEQEVSLQWLERGVPGLDQIIYSDLMNAYDTKLDQQLLHGTGTNNQHPGIFVLSGTNSVTYTDTTPTPEELLPKMYDAIQRVISNRFAPATHIVMHPRRAAWLANYMSQNYAVFHVGSGTGVGQQGGGLILNLSGLPVVVDANVTTDIGASTNEDIIGVVHANDLLLWEGPKRTRAFDSPLSNNLGVRLQVFAYSFFAIRYGASVSKISGTGLVPPTF